MKWIRFHPPGRGCSPSAIGRAAELCGPESRSRRLPRWTSAKAGNALRTREAEVAGVEVDAGGDVVDEDPDVDGGVIGHGWSFRWVGRARSATRRPTRSSSSSATCRNAGVGRRRRCRRRRPGRRCSSAPWSSTPGKSGQISRTLSHSVITRSKRDPGELPQVLGGVGGDVDAPLGHHPHGVGVERLGVAPCAARVDGVPGALDEQRLGDLRPGAVAGAEEQDPAPCAAAARRSGVGGGTSRSAGVERPARRGEQVPAAEEVGAVVDVAPVGGAASGGDEPGVAELGEVVRDEVLRRADRAP